MNERKISPIYKVFDQTNPTTGTYAVEINKKPYSKYMPFNNLRVVNDTDKSSIVLINDTQQVVVPHNTIMTLAPDTTPAIRNLKIEFSSDATGTVTMEIWKTRALIQKMERWF